MKCRGNQNRFQVQKCIVCHDVPKLRIVKKFCSGIRNECPEFCENCSQDSEPGEVCVLIQDGDVESCETCGECYVPPKQYPKKWWTGFRYTCSCISCPDEMLNVYNSQAEAVKMWNIQQRKQLQIAKEWGFRKGLTTEKMLEFFRSMVKPEGKKE